MVERKEIWAIDLRSLALLRIGIAILIISDLLIRSQDLIAHYTDAGVLSRSYLFAQARILPHLSLHMTSGSWQVQAILFLIAGIFGFLLLVGYKTRIATFASWYLLFSLHLRNPLVLHSDDKLLYLMLFWGIFLPWGRRFSLDRLLSPSSRGTEVRTFSLATLAYTAQIFFVYFSAALHKLNSPWWRDGTAVYYTLMTSHDAKPASEFLLQFPFLTRVLTHTVHLFEFVGPFLLFFPYFNPVIRVGTLLGFCLMHAGFGWFLELGLFPWVSIVSLFGFIPFQFWAKDKGESGETSSMMKASLFKPKWFENLFVGFLLIYVFLYNLSGTLPGFKMPSSLGYAGSLLRLHQRWSMTAYRFHPPDFWFFMPGVLKNGETVDLFKTGIQKCWDRSSEICLKNLHRREYPFYSFNPADLKKNEVLIPSYARYLCHDWNFRHRGDKTLERLEIFLVTQEILPDRKKANPNKELILKYVCP